MPRWWAGGVAGARGKSGFCGKASWPRIGEALSQAGSGLSRRLAAKLVVGLPGAKGPKTTLRRNSIKEQDFRRPLVASFWSSKNDFGFDFLEFEMISRP
jgi:hypothetical protein